MSTSDDNKQRLQHIFDALAEGDGRPFIEAMADDFTWTIAGCSAWSGRWQGKQTVRQDLLRPLLARFETTYRNRASRFIAEGDLVVVECRGDVMTRSGKPYRNAYCWICRLDGGRLVELTEYMDTAHALDALGAP